MSGGAVDTKTVEMRFDNSDFEKNAKQSMSTLEKLKRALKLDGASAGLREIEQASKKLDFKEFKGNIDSVGKKFSLLEEIAKGALRRIGSAAADEGIKVAKSLTIDQVAAGWDKYAQKTSAVQTIMANLRDTENKFADDSAKMAYVNSYLEKLMWFADETSYGFTDMTSNVGKFIANGLGLEESVTAMQGIATWAAISGQKADVAARAMYNISQAMGVGQMKMLDWKSIQNFNMATAEFKETAINAAIAMGKLKEGQVTLKSFDASLQKGWFDKEVMMDVFKTYGAAAEKVQEYALANNVSSTEAIRELKKQDAQFAKSLGFRAFAASQEAKTFQEVMEGTAEAVGTGWLRVFENIFGNYLEAKEMWTDLSEQLWEIFAEPLNRVNAAMKTWKRGFFENGPVNSLDAMLEAGMLDKLGGKIKYVSEEVANMAVASDSSTYSIEQLEDGTKRLCRTLTDSAGKVSKSYRTIYKGSDNLVSGRTALLEGFQNIFDAVVHDVYDENGKLESMSFFGSIKRGLLEAIFGTTYLNRIIPMASRKLWELTLRFRDFTEKLKPSMETSNKLKNSFRGLFTLFKIGGKFVRAVTKPFKEFIQDIFKKKEGSKGLLDLADSMGTWIQKLDQYLEKNKVFDTVSEKVKNGFNWIKTGIDGVVKSITGMSTTDIGSTIKTKLFGFFENYDFKGTFSNVVNFFKNIFSQIKEVNTETLPGKLTPLQNFWVGFKNILSAIKQFLSFMAPAFASIGIFINKIFTSIADAISNRKIENAGSKFSSIWGRIKSAFNSIKEFFSSIGGPALQKSGEWLGAFFTKFKEGVAKWAEGKSVEEVINSLVKGGFFISLTNFFNNLSKLKLVNTFNFINIAGGLKGLKDVLKAYKREINASTLLTIAATIAVLAGSMWVLAKIPSDKILQAGGAMVAIAGVVVGLAYAVGKLKEVMSKTSTAAAGGGIFASLKDLINGAIKSSVFGNDATAKFVKIAAGILMAAIAALVVVKAVGKVGEVIQQLAKIPPSDIQKGGTIFAQILLVLGAFSLLAGFSRHSTSVLFAALASYVVVKAIIKLVDYIAELGRSSAKMMSIQKVVTKFKNVFTAIKEIAGLVIKIFAAIAIAQLAIEAFSTGKGTDTMGMSRVLAQFGKNFTRIAWSLVIVAAAFAIMAVVSKDMDTDNLKAIGVIFAVFLGAVTILDTVVTGLASRKSVDASKLEAIANTIKSFGSTFTSMAASLLILAIAFGVMAFIAKRISPAQFAAISTMFLIFGGIAAVSLLGVTALTGWSKNPEAQAKSLLNFGGAFLMIAGSMAVLALAFGIMAQVAQHVSPVQFASISAMFLIFEGITSVSLLGVTALTGWSKNPESQAKSLLNFGGAFLMIAGAIGILSVAFALMVQASQHVSPVQFAAISGMFLIFEGITSVGLLGVTALTGWSKNPEAQAKSLLNFGGAFLMIAGAIGILSVAFALMVQASQHASTEDINSISKLFEVFTGIASVALLGVSALSGWSKNPGSQASAMLAFGGAFMMIAGSIVILALAIAIMVQAAQVAKPGQFEAITTLFTHFMIAAGALALVGAIFGKSAESIAGISAVSGLVMDTALSLLIVAAAFALLASVASVEQMEKVALIIGILGAVIAALAIIGVIAGATGAGIAGLGAVAGIILAIGDACLMAGAGLMLAAVGFAVLALSLSSFIDKVAEKGPAFAENVGMVVNAILDVIINTAPKVFTAIVAILNLIVSLAPAIGAAGAALIVGLAQGLASSASAIASAVTIILLTMFESFFSTLSVLVPPLVQGLILATNTLADAIRDNADAFWAAGANLIEALLEGIMLGVAKLGSWIPGVGDTISDIMERDLFPKMRKWFNIPEGAGTEAAREYTDELQAFDAGEEGAGVAKPNTEAAAEAGKADAEAYTTAAKGELDSGSKDLDTYKKEMLSKYGLGGDESNPFKLSTEGMTDSGILSLLSSFLGADGNLPGLEGGSLNIMDMLGIKDFDFSSLTAGFSDAFSGMDFKQFGIDNMADYASGVDESQTTVQASSESAASVIEQPIKALDSKTWGSDICSMLAQGINDSSPMVEAAASVVAGIIKSILGFSEPEKGPLSDFHTYAPDMINLWCNGIRSNLSSVEDSTTEVADTVYDGFSTALDYVSELIDNGMSDQLTIRPVMDLTEIQNGADSMRRLISSADGYEIDGTTRLAASTAYSMRPISDTSSTEQLPGQTDIGPTSNTFYITSNDPNAVAEKVSKILSSQTRRQKAVWAR